MRRITVLCLLFICLVTSCAPRLKLTKVAIINNRATQHSTENITEWCRNKHHYNGWIIICNKDSNLLIEPDTTQHGTLHEYYFPTGSFRFTPLR